MSVYVVTGTSSGIGFEIVKQISEDPSNLIIGLVRSKAAVEKKVAAEIGDRPNIHILHADLTSYASIEQAAADTTEIVGERGVDYLIANGAYLPTFDAFDPVGALAKDPIELDNVAAISFATNVTGNIHLFHLFLPLVMKGKAKKVITMSSGHADLDFINNLDVETSCLYSASKSAMNVIVSKFSAQYKKDGILFMSLSPGVVDVGKFDGLTPEQMQSLGGFMSKIQTYAPDFKGPMSVSDAVKTNRALWERVSIEDGYAGAFVSHLGNKQWL